MHEDALLPIGKVVRTHGTKGYLKVFSYAESPAFFAPGKKLTLTRQGKPVQSFEIESSSPQKRYILLALKGITSIEAAEKWVGCQVCTDKTSLPEPEEGSYYWYQIIGLEVSTVDGRHLGRVKAIFPTGSNDVYVVRKDKKELLIPAIESVVVDVDLKQRTLRVDLPEGLEQ